MSHALRVLPMIAALCVPVGVSAVTPRTPGCEGLSARECVLLEREHLAVDTVYAMHQGPTSWKEVLTLLAAGA